MNKSGIITTKNPSKIIAIQFSILSPDEIRRSSVAHITTRDTYVNNKPVINGIFDPRMGVLEPGLICPTDGLNYIQTPGYFGHIELARPVFYIQYFTHILKILRCVCYKCSKLLISKNKYKQALQMNSKERWDFIFERASKISRCGDDIDDGCGCKQPDKIRKDGLATIFAEWKKIEGIGEDGAENLIMKLTPEIVLKIFRRISDEDVSFMGFSPTFSRPDWMICQVLAVPPPAVRPSVKHDSQQRSEDDISHIIINIIKSNNTLLDKIEQNAKQNVIEDWTTVLQYYIATMINNKLPGVASCCQRSGRSLKSISERLNGKTGRVRGNLMGKRVDFSARSVITADPNLKIQELGVPLKIAMNLTYPVTVNVRNKNFLLKLVQNGPEKYPGAKILEKHTGESISLRYVDRDSIDLEYGDIVHRHMLDGDAVLFNRQPTLHRMSMMCHTAKIMKQGQTFRMNVADTKPYNADFDGDEMNMHVPQDEESVAELKHLATVSRQIISPATNSTIVGIFQDSLLGLYRLTRKGIKFSPRDAMNLLMNYTKINYSLFSKTHKEVSNFSILSQILPPLSTTFANGQLGDDENRKTSNNIIEIKTGELVRGQFDKSIKYLLHSIFNDFGFAQSADFINNLQDIVTEYMKSSSYSVGISDLIADKVTQTTIAGAITKNKQKVKEVIEQVQLGIFDNNTGKTNEEEFETQVKTILDKAREEAGSIGRKSLSKDNRFVIMVNAGSKGNNINIAQMISCLGQQSVDGKRIPYGFEDRTLPHYTKYNDSPEARGFVENSFIQGLTPQELFFHAMGGRVGLIDTAVKTSQTGYIQRRLVKGMEDIKIEYDMTVRNHMKKIIQFEYGGDGIDTTKVENQTIPLVKMTIEEIYAHYQMPADSLDDAVYTTNYTASTLKRIKKQRDATKQKTKEHIDNMLKYRQELVENVFNYEDTNKVHIPVHFKRIINNIKHQLNLQSNSLVNITPLECFEIIEDNKNQLKKIQCCKPTKLFFIMYDYFMSPKELLMTHKFNRKSLNVLCMAINTNYKKAIVTPGEMVGMLAAQSIGEPTTQLTLNTFHFAGVSSKSNATRGVPRIEELLSLSQSPKKPSVTVYLKKEDERNIQKAQQMMYMLEYTCLRDVTQSVEICFDPDNLSTLIDEDKELLVQYKEFETMMKECADVTEDTEKQKSKWIIRFVLDKNNMLDKNISMDDINFAISSGYKDEVECVFSDFNSDKLIFRIRLMDMLSSKKKKGNAVNLTEMSQKSLDQSDEIYMLKNVQENLLNNIILKGIKQISAVTLRKIQNNIIKEDGNYINKEIWVLDTVGTNLIDILAMNMIDYTRCYSNDIIEVYKTLGIEAARQMIFNEIMEVLEFGGSYVNSHHIELLCDRMCATTKMVSIFRHGINNDNIGPIAKASFEETPEMFLRAARHAELDTMRGISSNVMCGQRGNYGTNAFQLVLDINEMVKLGSKKLEEKVKIENLFDIKDVTDECSINKIKIGNNPGLINTKSAGVIDDSYKPGF